MYELYKRKAKHQIVEKSRPKPRLLSYGKTIVDYGREFL